MVRTSGLSFSYTANTILRFDDITCKAGNSLLVTGGSGTGKTTLLHILGGLQDPATGSVEVDGVEINKLTGRQRDKFRGKNIGLVLQESHFISSLSVIENVELSSWLGTGSKQRNSAFELLGKLGLEDQAKKHPSELSIGQQQRVSIARALINKPKLLLADEPTSSLDDENAAIVAGILENMSAEYNTALIIVTHDQRLKERFSNSISL